MNSIEVMARRKLIFKYISLGLNPADIHGLVEDKYPCSLKTIRRDIMSLGDWLPQLVKINEGESDEVLMRILGGLQLAEDRLLQLSFDGDNSSSMVGATKGYASILLQEAQLRMDAGIIKRAPFRAEFETAWTPLEENKFERMAVEAIRVNFMHSEADRHRRMEYENSHPGESGGKESVENWVGPPEGVPTENGFRNEALMSGSPVKDTSAGGTRVGGYVSRRR